MAAFRKGRLQGLSCLKGNFHEQFLGGWAGAILPGYPAPVGQPLALPGSRPPPVAACAPAGVSAWGRRLTAGVRVSAGTSRHSGEGCKSLTVKDQPTTLAPSHAQASVTASAKR